MVACIIVVGAAAAMSCYSCAEFQQTEGVLQGQLRVYSKINNRYYLRHRVPLCYIEFDNTEWVQMLVGCHQSFGHMDA